MSSNKYVTSRSQLTHHTIVAHSFVLNTESSITGDSTMRDCGVNWSLDSEGKQFLFLVNRTVLNSFLNGVRGIQFRAPMRLKKNYGNTSEYIFQRDSKSNKLSISVRLHLRKCLRTQHWNDQVPCYNGTD